MAGADRTSRLQWEHRAWPAAHPERGSSRRWAEGTGRRSPGGSWPGRLAGWRQCARAARPGPTAGHGRARRWSGGTARSASSPGQARPRGRARTWRCGSAKRPRPTSGGTRLGHRAQDVLWAVISDSAGRRQTQPAVVAGPTGSRALAPDHGAGACHSQVPAPCPAPRCPRAAPEPALWRPPQEKGSAKGFWGLVSEDSDFEPIRWVLPMSLGPPPSWRARPDPALLGGPEGSSLPASSAFGSGQIPTDSGLCEGSCSTGGREARSGPLALGAP